MAKKRTRLTIIVARRRLSNNEWLRGQSSCDSSCAFNKNPAEFPHPLGGGMNAVQAIAGWLMKPLHYSNLLVLYTV